MHDQDTRYYALLREYQKTSFNCPYEGRWTPEATKRRYEEIESAGKRLFEFIISDKAATLRYFNEIFSNDGGLVMIMCQVSSVSKGGQKTFFDWLLDIDDPFFVKQVVTRIVNGVLSNWRAHHKYSSWPTAPSTMEILRDELKKIYSRLYCNFSNDELRLLLGELIGIIGDETISWHEKESRLEQRRKEELRQATDKIKEEAKKRELSRQKAFADCRCYSGESGNHYGGTDCRCPCHRYDGA